MRYGIGLCVGTLLCGGLTIKTVLDMDSDPQKKIYG